MLWSDINALTYDTKIICYWLFLHFLNPIRVKYGLMNMHKRYNSNLITFYVTRVLIGSAFCSRHSNHRVHSFFSKCPALLAVAKECLLLDIGWFVLCLYQGQRHTSVDLRSEVNELSSNELIETVRRRMTYVC